MSLRELTHKLYYFDLAKDMKKQWSVLERLCVDQTRSYCLAVFSLLARVGLLPLAFEKRSHGLEGVGLRRGFV